METSVFNIKEKPDAAISIIAEHLENNPESEEGGKVYIHWTYDDETETCHLFTTYSEAENTEIIDIDEALTNAIDREYKKIIGRSRNYTVKEDEHASNEWGDAINAAFPKYWKKNIKMFAEYFYDEIMKQI